MRLLCAILIFLGGLRLQADEVMPHSPAQYFNDYAGVVSSDTASQLNRELADFERQTSEQILVVVYPTMQSDSDIADYTVRVARSWQVGQKGKNNGAVLFVFVQNHKMFLQVGYGLEGALPDALCKRIIDEQIAPRFKAGDFDGGLTAGVQSIIAATKGEYKGDGQTVADQRDQTDDRIGSLIVPLFVIFMIFVILRVRGFLWGLSNTLYWGGGWSGSDRNNSSGGWFSGGWGGGGGGFSGGGGGFSGGGGSFGGGGAGGSW